MTTPRVGVLGLQGSYREHIGALQRLGVESVVVRTPADLVDLHALVMPGGESTTIGKLLKSTNLYDVLCLRLKDGDLAIFGTCAGMILCARSVEDGTIDQVTLSAFNATVRRNGMGRQSQSGEVALTIGGQPSPISAVFIRPPVVVEVAPEVEVLATHNENPVLCAQGRHLFATFHPELTDETKIHELFLERLN